jgi:uncharacterized protein
MAHSFSGKTALITGASVGIGRDLAELFAKEGHHLILTARNKAQLDELAQKFSTEFGIQVDVIAKDLSIANAGREIFERVGELGRSVDFLVNNAGFGTHGPFAEADIASQLGMLQVNGVALTELSRLFLPGMIQRKSGRILNVASTAAFLPGPLMAVYYASKAYVLSFSEALDSELEGTGVSVTALCPGPTNTEFQKRAGISHTKLFAANTMTSMEVARIGYQAMLAGRRRVITGARNRVMITAAKFAPRRWVTALARNLNKNR